MGRSVEQWAALVSAHIAGCTSCVGYFGNEDGYFGIDGVHSDPDDLLMSLDVPERLRPEVLARAACGECRNSIADEAEIWVWSEAEVEFRSRVARARERYEPRLSEFRDFLAKHPYLGATHRTGRALMSAVRKAKGIAVEGRWWRCIKERETELVKADFRAPREEQEHPIHEGRYNHAGQPHWYLADTRGASPITAEGNMRELPTRTTGVVSVRPIDPRGAVADQRGSPSASVGGSHLGVTRTPPLRFLRFPEVRERTGLSRSTIWRLERRGDFPKHTRISTNVVAWVEEDIVSWIRARAGLRVSDHDTNIPQAENAVARR